MRTILDRQVAMLATKKNDLPEKPEDKKVEEKKSASKPQEEPIKKPEESIKKNHDKYQEPERK